MQKEVRAITSKVHGLVKRRFMFETKFLDRHVPKQSLGTSPKKGIVGAYKEIPSLYSEIVLSNMTEINYAPNNKYAVVREYAKLAAQYDRRWAFYIEATLSETLKRMDPKPHDNLLDIGCGTGSLLQVISRNYPSVKIVGVDLSVEMLKVARNKQIKDGAFIAGQALCLPFRSKSFDMVVSCNVFHYLRKPEECLAEISRILKPQGRVVITDWCDDYIACRVCDLFLRVFNRAHFKTYGRRACEHLLRNAGYSNIQVERYKINWLWGLMTAKAQTNHF